MTHTSNTLAEIAAVCRQAESVLVVSHYSPDGDAFGSAGALALGLRSLGKKVVLLNQDGPQKHFEFIPGVAEHVTTIPKQTFDLLVVCDCGDFMRVGDGLLPALREFPKIVNIDHHASNDFFGHLNFVAPQLSSTSEIIFGLLSELRVALTKDIARALFAGISFDTGSFRHSCTSPATFRIAGELIAAGASPNEISRALFDDISFSALKLQGEALSKLQLHADGKVAEVMVTAEMSGRYGAAPDEVKALVSIALSIKGVCVSVYIREDSPLWRISLRSVDAKYDVAKIAEEFGGGGHRQAAAFRSKKPLTEIRAKLLSLLEASVK